MIRVLLTILTLTTLVYLGVSLWYERVEQGFVAFIPAESEVVKPAEDGSTAVVVNSVLSGDYEVIVSRNIFQALLEIGDKEPLPAEDENHEETSLKLVLLGTVVGNDMDARAIIIDEQEKKQDLFRIGDSVQNARIRKIGRGRVILDVNGRTESLTIKERKGGGPSAPIANRGRAVTQSKERAAAQKRVPVVRPKRRISFREGRTQLPEAVEEPEEPLMAEEEAEPEEPLMAEEEGLEDFVDEESEEFEAALEK